MADLDTDKLLQRMRVDGPKRDPFGLVGQVLDEQFRVDAVVGEGGFSVVYRGQHLGLSEPIAIKCLMLPGALGSAAVESFVQRFRDEGRILYKLSQGNLHVVRSIASGMTQGPLTGALIPYTVLEWLDGYSLAEELEARRRAGFRGRHLHELVPLFDSAILAVAYAHTQGVVHRDLNPGNIFFTKTREGMRAKILDFGLAKVISDHALELGPRAATLQHLQIFAPAYAAPEQMDKRLGPIGAYTDVYTLALVILESMLDRSVISGEHVGEIMAKTLGMHRPSPRGLGVHVSDEIEALFASALNLHPDKRLADAGVFWGTLKNTLAREGVPPERLSSEPPPGRGFAGGIGEVDLARPYAAASSRPPPTGRESEVPGSRHPWFPQLKSTMPLAGPAADARRIAMEQASAYESSRPPPAHAPGQMGQSADLSRPSQQAPATQEVRRGESASSPVAIRILIVLVALAVGALGVVYVVRGIRGH